MRGFLSLEPDPETLQRLRSTQNRLVDALARQGVHFPERLGVTLLAWPFATLDELDEAGSRLPEIAAAPRTLAPLSGTPNDDRPAEVGHAVEGLDDLQSSLFSILRSTLDPDPPKPAFVRLARVSPPSRKVGAALRGVRTSPGGLFVPASLTIWRQSPTGFERHADFPLAPN